ncbi:hypothetical protein ADIAL_1373 [Alkalibacterium sp. AK22]|nr:hypothetical protein ADIAL_1373 [Alkalibacterium sp. AK22]
MDGVGGSLDSTVDAVSSDMAVKTRFSRSESCLLPYFTQ